MDTPVLVIQQKLIFNSCVDTDCHLENLPRVITNRDRWRERERESQGNLLLAYLDDDNWFGFMAYQPLLVI